MQLIEGYTQAYTDEEKKLKEFEEKKKELMSKTWKWRRKKHRAGKGLGYSGILICMVKRLFI